MTDETPITIREALDILEKREDEWQKLERSQAGEVLRAAWVAARPILQPIAQEGAAVLFGALAERIAKK